MFLWLSVWDRTKRKKTLFWSRIENWSFWAFWIGKCSQKLYNLSKKSLKNHFLHFFHHFFTSSEFSLVKNIFFSPLRVWNFIFTYFYPKRRENFSKWHFINVGWSKTFCVLIFNSFKSLFDRVLIQKISLGQHLFFLIWIFSLCYYNFFNFQNFIIYFVSEITQFSFF